MPPALFSNVNRNRIGNRPHGELATTVLVVGAGPTGLAAALELARQGRPVRIVDRKPGRSQHSKAIGVNARTLELLEPSGVTERLLATGLRVRRLNFRNADRLLATIELAHVHPRYDFMLTLLQAETERLLEQRLAEAGTSVEWSSEFKALEADADRVRAQLIAGGREQTVEADWLIGADGAHSAVRHALGPAFEGETDPSEWWLADVRMSWPFGAAEVDVFARPGAVLAVIPIELGLFRLVSNGPDPLTLLAAGGERRGGDLALGLQDQLPPGRELSARAGVPGRRRRARAFAGRRARHEPRHRGRHDPRAQDDRRRARDLFGRAPSGRRPGDPPDPRADAPGHGPKPPGALAARPAVRQGRSGRRRRSSACSRSA